MPMAFASQPGSPASLASALARSAAASAWVSRPARPLQVGQQVPSLGQAEAVAEAVEGGDGQLHLVAALAQEQPRVVHGGDAEPADGGVQGQAPVADRRRRPGQLLVGPGRLGELAAGLLRLGQRGQGGQPQGMVGGQQPGRPAQPRLDQTGVAADGGALPGRRVALAGPPGQLGRPVAARVEPAGVPVGFVEVVADDLVELAAPVRGLALQPVGVARVQLGPAVVGQPLVGDGLDGGVPEPVAGAAVWRQGRRGWAVVGAD
jgi:hypothetical protein